MRWDMGWSGIACRAATGSEGEGEMRDAIVVCRWSGGGNTAAWHSRGSPPLREIYRDADEREEEEEGSERIETPLRPADLGLPDELQRGGALLLGLARLPLWGGAEGGEEDGDAHDPEWGEQEAVEEHVASESCWLVGC